MRACINVIVSCDLLLFNRIYIQPKIYLMHLTRIESNILNIAARILLFHLRTCVNVSSYFTNLFIYFCITLSLYSLL